MFITSADHFPLHVLSEEMRCARGIFSTDTVARTTDFPDENVAVGFQIMEEHFGESSQWMSSGFADHGQLNKNTGDPITTYIHWDKPPSNPAKKKQVTYECGFRELQDDCYIYQPCIGLGRRAVFWQSQGNFKTLRYLPNTQMFPIVIIIVRSG